MARLLVKGLLYTKKESCFFAHIDNEYRTIFNSTRELETISEDKSIFGVKFNHALISAVCRGERKSHKGYTFKYMGGIA